MTSDRSLSHSLLGQDGSTPSAEDSPARTSHSLARELALTVLGRVSGARCAASSAFYDRTTSSWRTSQLSLLEGSTECLEIFPKAGSMRSGSLYERQTWAPLTEESGCSSWLTPTAQDANPPGPKQLSELKKWRDGHSIPRTYKRLRGQASIDWSTPIRDDAHSGPTSSPCPESSLLQEDGELWPTPDASVVNEQESSESWLARRERLVKQKRNGNGMGTPLAMAVKLWPTATATDANSSGTAAYSTESGRHSGTTLTDATARTTGGRLNPDWVEHLMGFPDGWTAGPLDVAKSSTRGKRRELLTGLPLTTDDD